MFNNIKGNFFRHSFIQSKEEPKKTFFFTFFSTFETCDFGWWERLIMTTLAMSLAVEVLKIMMMIVMMVKVVMVWMMMTKATSAREMVKRPGAHLSALKWWLILTGGFFACTCFGSCWRIASCTTRSFRS